ncbi:hypothetical protein [Streptomyces sudanensis]|uniref:hypothetical protein n=1 Tax=Streptomyces sudanensis TaxID=436397 RepID=UPI0020CCF6F0|nr:hypothetical protein [Streptomyces sudanensis]MCQ0001367.1 hypothetical protein [Streptomyces sudanensis]
MTTMTTNTRRTVWRTVWREIHVSWLFIRSDRWTTLFPATCFVLAAAVHTRLPPGGDGGGRRFGRAVLLAVRLRAHPGQPARRP